MLVDVTFFEFRFAVRRYLGGAAAATSGGRETTTSVRFLSFRQSRVPPCGRAIAPARKLEIDRAPSRTQPPCGETAGEESGGEWERT